MTFWACVCVGWRKHQRAAHERNAHTVSNLLLGGLNPVHIRHGAAARFWRNNNLKPKRYGLTFTAPRCAFLGVFFVNVLDENIFRPQLWLTISFVYQKHMEYPEKFGKTSVLIRSHKIDNNSCCHTTRGISDSSSWWQQFNTKRYWVSRCKEANRLSVVCHNYTFPTFNIRHNCYTSSKLLSVNPFTLTIRVCAFVILFCGDTCCCTAWREPRTVSRMYV